MSQPTLTTSATSGTRPIGEVLTEAFHLYRDNLVVMLITAGIALGPVYFVKNGLMALFVPGIDASTARVNAQADSFAAMSAKLNEKIAAGTATPEELERYQKELLATAGVGVKETGGMLMWLFGLLASLLLTIPLVIIANLLAQAALTVLLADRAAGGNIGWQGAWSKTVTRLPALLITALVTGLGVALGTLMCVLPGLLFAFGCAFVMPIALLEGRAGPEAIKRSIELVKADWLRVVIVMVVAAVLSYVASAIGSMLIPNSWVFLDSLVGDLVSILVLPLPIIGLVLLYREQMEQRGEPMQAL